MSRRSVIAMLAVAAVVVAGVVIYSTFDPSASRWFPRCPFLMLTGLKCPGCGTQRAIHALLHGDVLSALHFNALLPVSIPLLLLYGYAELVRTRKPRFYNRVNSVTAILAVLIVVIVWWIVRNIFGC
ncbi:MAG: DUF2752 domain-containing protein [Bacteroidales bacterium]|nr:DUF2752 domain-containing protein [Bacteroidales bacterium]MEE0906696.1 DUF2752 domain-containing protein [Muribaculaceae bacterium]